MATIGDINQRAFLAAAREMRYQVDGAAGKHSERHNELSYRCRIPEHMWDDFQELYVGKGGDASFLEYRDGNGRTQVDAIWV